MTEKKNETNKGVQGEGDYEATRNFDRAQERFVKSHKDEIPKKAEEARRALESKEGEELRAAEERAKSHSKSRGNER
jgi:hypothetical protein